MSIPDIEAVENPKETARHIKKIIEQGHDRFETRHKCKDGRIIDVEVSVNHLDFGEGRQFVFIRDITERKQMVEALKQSEHMYSTLVQEGNDGIVIVQDEVIKFANPKIIEITGYSLDEILQKLFTKFITPDDREMVEDRYTRRIKKEEIPGRYEAQVIHLDGKSIPVEISASTIEFEGSPAVMAIVRDITERKEAERRIRASRRRFRELVDLLPLGGRLRPAILLLADLGQQRVPFRLVGQHLDHRGVRPLGLLRLAQDFQSPTQVAVQLDVPPGQLQRSEQLAHRSPLVLLGVEAGD